MVDDEPLDLPGQVDRLGFGVHARAGTPGRGRPRLAVVDHPGQLAAAVQHHEMDGTLGRHPPIVAADGPRTTMAQIECGSWGSSRPAEASSSRTTENASPEA